MLRQATIRCNTRHWRPAFACTGCRNRLYSSASTVRGRDAVLGTDKARAGDGGYGDGAYLVNQNDNNCLTSKNTHSEAAQQAKANDDVALTGIEDDDLLGLEFAESEAPEGLP